MQYHSPEEMETGNLTQSVPRSLGLLKYVAQRKELERIEAKRNELTKLYHQTEAKLLAKSLDLKISEGKLLAKTEDLKKSEANLLAKTEELKKSVAENLAKNEELMISEAQKEDLSNLLRQSESQNKQLEKVLEQIGDEVENLKRAHAHCEQVKKFELEQTRAVRKDLEEKLTQSEAQVEDLKEALGKSEAEKIEMKERVILEQKKADELVAWLAEARKKWESEKERLRCINTELAKQLEDAKMKSIDDEFEVVDDEFDVKVI
ncbi:dixin-like [Rosa sericea]